MYCSESDVGKWVSTEGSDQDFINDLIGSADEYIDDVTGDRFIKEDGAVKLFDGNAKKLLLINPSLRKATKVELLDEVSGGVTYEFTREDYLWGRGWIKVRGDISKWPLGKDNVRITGNWGWEETPKSIKLLSARIAALALSGGVTVGQTVQSESLGSYSVNYSTDGSSAGGPALFSIDDILDRYRLHKVIMGTPRRRPRVSLESDIEAEMPESLRERARWE